MISAKLTDGQQYPDFGWVKKGKCERKHLIWRGIFVILRWQA